MRLNIWVYDTGEKQAKQVTFLKDFDISFLSGGSGELVFEAGGDLYLMDAGTKSYVPVKVSVVSDLSLEMPKSVNVGSKISNFSASPEGKRVVFEARGELFNAPVKEGYTLNLTQSSGAFDMLPAWSPDGKNIAYWSDRSGEYELYIQDPDKKSDPVQLTKRGKGFGYQIYWSPDSKKIAYIDETNDISILDVESKEVIVAGNYRWNYGHGGRYGYPIAWSPDSKWIAFSEGLDNSHNAIKLFNLDEKIAHQVSSGFYDDSNPVFSEDGKYLYFLSNRSMQASYSDMGDGTWIYPNSTQVAAVALQADTPSLLQPKNDALEKSDKADGEEGEKDDDKADKKEKSKKGKDDDASSKDGEDDKKDEKSKVEVKIDFENFESRVSILPVKAGNIGMLASFKDKVVYLKRPNTGSESRSSSLMYWDLEEREEKTIISDVSSVKLTADGKDLIVSVKGKYGIIKAAENQKVDKPVPTGDLVMSLVPREEWRQLFNDTWRRHRDFFYDPDMQGVDWEAMKLQYGPLIEDARSRWDVSNITTNMAAELSAGHTYVFGGDVEQVKSVSTGFLGIDWEKQGDLFHDKKDSQTS